MAQENAEVQEVKVGGLNGSPKAVVYSFLKPQLLVQAPKAADAVQFYKAAFGAEELKRATHPKRKAEQDLPLILSAELKIGPSVIIVGDQTDETAKTTDGAGFSFCLVADDVEPAVAKAVKAGASVVEPVPDSEAVCCGARSVTVKDPFGYVWSICAAEKSCADVEA
ncbi:hypothetical protein CKAN_01611900 [Cinnamomum micranthum f. kanehirae]|uniref:VOC domain-containing protein n=1 Tax=Cinnamomum micranthum f. kanehirae TaxID=337451 RepID=A0A3S3QNG8_9MAGN|nr:hypothetical protein CKAN_01611900 [Cinnamomum micranthum f. kanehirae]